MSARKTTSRFTVKLDIGDYKKLIKDAAENLAVYVKDCKKSRSYTEHLEIMIKAKAAEMKRYIDEMVAIAIKPEEPKKEAQEEKEEVKKKVKKEVKKEDNDNDNDNYDYDTVN